MSIATIAAAYDRVAAEYDAILAADAWQRRALWAHYRRVFHPGQRVLDLSCGTGTDALFLAARGVSVLGIDASPAMLRRFEEKLARLRRNGATAGHRPPTAAVLPAAGADSGGSQSPQQATCKSPSPVAGGRRAASGALEAAIELRTGSYLALGDLDSGSFDGILSAYAGLNTTADWSELAGELWRLLRPGGRAVFHLLNRFRLWEWLGLVVRLRLRAAARLRREDALCVRIGGRPVWHYLRTPREAIAPFERAGFRLVEAYGLGVLCPPAVYRRLPSGVGAALQRLERALTRREPLRSWGAFYVLDLERT